MASVTWVAHFLLIGAVAGAAMNSVGVVRSVSYYNLRSHERLSWVPWIVVLLSVVATIITWQGIVSLLPMTAMIIACFALWQPGEQVVRLLLISCVPLWFVYNVIFHSYAGMASDVIALLSGLIALYRYRKQGYRAATHAKT